MDRYTLIVVPEGIGQIRRCQVRIRWLRWLAAAWLIGAIAVGAGTYDWLRVRGEAAEVARLRVEVLEHRSRTAELEAGAERVRLELDRLEDFERRVRVIANLPARSLEASVETPRSGVGGGAGSPAAATPPIGVPAGAFSVAPDSKPSVESAPGSNPAAELAPATQDSEPLSSLEDRLERRARVHVASLDQLLQQLEGKGERLASTPSVWPTRGWVTSQFGWRISPFTGKRDLHEGIDIAGDFGTPVTAPARASVAFVGTRGPLGNALVLDHGHGVRTTYGHLRETLVRSGDQVERGQAIATIGNTGRSTGPHLHYSIEVRGRPVNPLDYVIQ